jgi:CDP-diglyceride synthetase
VASILDFLLAAIGFGVVLTLLSRGIAFEFAGPPGGPTAIRFDIPWQMMLLPALVVGYFAVLGGTGGTVFQRVFGMKRGKVSEEMMRSCGNSDGTRNMRLL